MSPNAAKRLPRRAISCFTTPARCTLKPRMNTDFLFPNMRARPFDDVRVSKT